MEIVKGKTNAPVRAVIYGPEGIGKSTLAAQLPAPLFIDAEGGTARLEVDRVNCGSWGILLQTIEEFQRNPGGYKTLVFDTADWLEKMAAQSVCFAHKQDSIEGFGYGKGYTYLAEEWKRFMDKISAMQAATGVAVVFLAHAAMRKFEQPDETGSYDRWEMKLTKQTCPVMKEWPDLLLFLNYKTIVVEAEGKKKGTGGKRVIYTQHHACWDAKSRFVLPEELPFKDGKLPAELAAIFVPAPAAPAATAPVITEVQPPAATAAPAATGPCQTRCWPAPAPAPAAPTEIVQLHDQLKGLLKASNVTVAQLQAEIGRKGICPADMHPRNYNEATLKRIIGNWDKVLTNIRLIESK
jgi:hypothetical protein